MAGNKSNVIKFPIKPIDRPIHLTAQDTGPDEIEVIAAIGEKISWYEDWKSDVPLHVKVLADEETGKPILKFRKLSDYGDTEYTFRGYDEEKKLWWLDPQDGESLGETRSLMLHIMRKERINTGPQGIILTAEDTGTEGIDVLAILGECYGDEIQWFHKTVYRVVVKNDFVTGKPNLSYSTIDESGKKHTFHKRGFEVATRTWWRYSHETDPNEYREHCLRILQRV